MHILQEVKMKIVLGDRSYVWGALGTYSAPGWKDNGPSRCLHISHPDLIRAVEDRDFEAYVAYERASGDFDDDALDELVSSGDAHRVFEMMRVTSVPRGSVFRVSMRLEGKRYVEYVEYVGQSLGWVMAP